MNYGRWDKIDVEVVGTLTEDDVRHIMKLCDDGFNSKEIAQKIDKTFIIVNQAIVANGKKTFISAEARSEDEIENENKVLPARAGYFKKLAEQKSEQIQGLREMQDSLALNVKALWKMVRLLELRKRQLESYVMDMEKYLANGSDLLDFMKDKMDVDDE